MHRAEHCLHCTPLLSSTLCSAAALLTMAASSENRQQLASLQPHQRCAQSEETCAIERTAISHRAAPVCTPLCRLRANCCSSLFLFSAAPSLQATLASPAPARLFSPPTRTASHSATLICTSLVAIPSPLLKHSRLQPFSHGQTTQPTALLVAAASTALHTSVRRAMSGCGSNGIGLDRGCRFAASTRSVALTAHIRFPSFVLFACSLTFAYTRK